MSIIQRISTNLWFDNQAEEAVTFYTSIFRDSKVGRISYYGDGNPSPDKNKLKKVMTIEFVIEGQSFVALNGGPNFKFTEAISFIVQCDSQEEIDYSWEKLSEKGEESAQACGWLKDQFGISWQVVPRTLAEMVSNPDSAKSERVMQALLKMKKIDIQTLQQIYDS